MKMLVNEICVKQIRVNQGLDVPIFIISSLLIDGLRAATMCVVLFKLANSQLLRSKEMWMIIPRL